MKFCGTGKQTNMNNKLYECKVEGCTNKQPILSKGKCDYHRQLELAETRTPEVAKPKQNGFGNFFKRHIKTLSAHPYSQNSGKYIGDVSSKNICHILPKRDRAFPSLALDDRNIIYLTWQEHADFDNLIDKKQFRKIEEKFPNLYPLIVERVTLLLKDCTETNKFRWQVEDWINGE